MEPLSGGPEFGSIVSFSSLHQLPLDLLDRGQAGDQLLLHNEEHDERRDRGEDRTGADQVPGRLTHAAQATAGRRSTDGLLSDCTSTSDQK